MHPPTLKGAWWGYTMLFMEEDKGMVEPYKHGSGLGYDRLLPCTGQGRKQGHDRPLPCRGSGHGRPRKNGFRKSVDSGTWFMVGFRNFRFLESGARLLDSGTQEPVPSFKNSELDSEVQKFII